MQFSRMSNKQVDEMFANLMVACSSELKQERKRRAKEKKIEADAERIKKLKAEREPQYIVAEIKADAELREEVVREMTRRGISLHVAMQMTAIKRELLALAIRYEVI